MNLLEILKQFKNIAPDPAFTATSKRAILAQEPAPAIRGWSAQRSLWRIIEVGAAVALTGFFVLLITGAFSGTGITPQYSAIDPQGLRAEAQAIDIQIQLANLNYNEAAAQSTMQIAGVKPAGSGGGKTTSPTPAATAPNGATATATSTASSATVSIDQILQSLSQ